MQSTSTRMLKDPAASNAAFAAFGATRRGMTTCAALIVAALGATAAQAIVVRYEVIPLGGQRFEYVYTVENDGSLGAAAPVVLFHVAFDPDFYRSSSLATATALPLSGQWDEKLLAGAPGIPVAYDARATSGSIPVGSAVGGFSVRFDWLGTGTPGPQTFDVYDPTTFDRIEQGITVDAPPTPWLAVTLVSALLARRRARQRRTPR